MPVSQVDLKLLWGRTGSTCAMCRTRLDRLNHDRKPAVIGEAAHIVAENEGGPRGSSILKEEERNSYFNLILLCPTCHTIIDKDPTGYPAERLHISKAQHELRMQGYDLSGKFEETQELETTTDVVAFVKAWREFLSFYHVLYIKIESALLRDENMVDLIQNGPIKQWHEKREMLKNLLFRCKEENLIVQPIPDWERLVRKNSYLSEGEYMTPFSFILDFRNPIAMVNLSGEDLWAASFISQEFMDYLSYKYEDVRAVWNPGIHVV